MSSHDERRLSINGRNAYIFLNGESVKNKNICDPQYNKNYLTAKPLERARSCSPVIQLHEENTQTISPTKNCLEQNIKENMKKQNITTTMDLKTTHSMPVNTQACNPLPTITSESLKLFNPSSSADKNDGTHKGAIPKNKISTTKSEIPTGMLRYVSINKRNLSPQKSLTSAKKQKVINKPLMSNRFALLSDDMETNHTKDDNSNKKSSKPPPIYLREPSSNNLVKSFIELIGKNNFHIVPIRKGGVQETKIVVYTEDCYRKISLYLNDCKKNFYTYQLKSSKGLTVVIKGIESSVEPVEIKEALEELGYQIKVVVNIFNKDKIPQPMFRVELEPNEEKLKKNETHPIYSLRYLLNRRVTIEEPLKRKGPVQCGNCQEFGHTKNYCTLRTVCVACGDLHSSSQCDIVKKGLKRKCGNCGGDHSANYRGCPVYKELLKRLRENQKLKRNGIVELAPVNTVTNQMNSGVGDSNEGMASVKPNLTINQMSMANPGNISYANVLRKNYQQPNVPQISGGLETLMQTLTQTVSSLNQNMTNFMSSMQNTIQELLRAQNQMIQILLTRK